MTKNSLHSSAKAGAKAEFSELLKGNASEAVINSVDDDGYSLLASAVIGKNAEIVDTLLRAGANPNIQAEDGQTPLHLAATYGESAIATMLLNSGAKVDARDTDQVTPLHMAATSEIATLLKEKGANLEARDINGRTPLMTVIGHGDREQAAEAIIKMGANTKAVDNEKVSVMEFAQEANASGALVARIKTANMQASLAQTAPTAARTASTAPRSKAQSVGQSL